MYQFDWATTWIAMKYIIQGVDVTIGVSVTALILAILIGLPIGVLRTRDTLLARLLNIYVEVFRNIPVLVLIVWVYYVLPILIGLNLSPIVAGTLALTLNTSAFLAEVFRGGIKGIAIGQTEAAGTLGMTHVMTLRYIILPQMFRKMLAPLLNQFIVLIKESALIAYIGVLEIMHRGDMISTQFSRPLEAYTVVAVYYLILCYVVSRLAAVIEAKFAIPE